MSPHDHRYVDSWQGAIVKIGASERERHEAGGRGIPGRMIIDHQIVVDCLGNVHTAKRIVGSLSLLTQDAQGVR